MFLLIREAASGKSGLWSRRVSLYSHSFARPRQDATHTAIMSTMMAYINLTEKFQFKPAV